MNIRIAQLDDIDTLFEIRTSVVENYQSCEEIAELGITPESVAKMLEIDCCAWVVGLLFAVPFQYLFKHHDGSSITNC